MSQIVIRKPLLLNNRPEIHICNSWRHQQLFLIASQLQDSTFLTEINSEDFGISKLVLQLKLLQNSFKLKENDTIDMSNIIKICKICHKINAF